jgi:hypothetical protein
MEIAVHQAIAGRMTHPNSLSIPGEIAPSHEIVGRIVEHNSATEIFPKRAILYIIDRAILQRDAIQIAHKITFFYPILYFII